MDARKRTFRSQPRDSYAGGGAGWPQAKSLSLIPESYRWALAYGRNPFNGRETPFRRVRNVVRWHRPNPPVGALGDKFRRATSDVVIACKSRTRFFDLDAVRTEHQRNPSTNLRHGKGIGDEMGRNYNHGKDEFCQRRQPSGRPAARYLGHTHGAIQEAATTQHFRRRWC